jgi:hypothetical protein
MHRASKSSILLMRSYKLRIACVSSQGDQPLFRQVKTLSGNYALW